MRVALVLVAAGSGSRFGAAIPKQFTAIAGRPTVRWAAEALLPHTSLLQPVGDAAALKQALVGLDHLPPVAGGATRQDSVRAGLEALVPHAPDVVLVHDAARPYVPYGTVPGRGGRRGGRPRRGRRAAPPPPAPFLPCRWPTR